MAGKDLSYNLSWHELNTNIPPTTKAELIDALMAEPKRWKTKKAVVEINSRARAELTFTADPDENQTGQCYDVAAVWTRARATGMLCDAETCRKIICEFDPNNYEQICLIKDLLGIKYKRRRATGVAA